VGTVAPVATLPAGMDSNWTTGVQGFISRAQNTVSKVKTDLTTNVKVALPPLTPVPAAAGADRAGLAGSLQDAFNKKDVQPEVDKGAEDIVEEAMHGIRTGLDRIADTISEPTTEEAKQGRKAVITARHIPCIPSTCLQRAISE
jgi:hypothetical protein